MPKPLPASRRAKKILVPAAVAAAENMRGGLAQARPSGFLIPGSDLVALHGDFDWLKQRSE